MFVMTCNIVIILLCADKDREKGILADMKAAEQRAIEREAIASYQREQYGHVLHTGMIASSQFMPYTE